MCGKDKDTLKDNLQDGKILEERSCTDCPMILVFLIFCIGWTIVAVVAIQNGKPSRILLPENFRGDLCGDTGTRLEFFAYQYIPKPSRQTYGLCSRACPPVFDYVCNNDIEALLHNATVDEPNTYYDHTATQWTSGPGNVMACAAGTCDYPTLEAANRYLGLLQKVDEYKCFFVFYSTGPTLHRCMPFGANNDNATLAELAGETSGAVTALADAMGVSSFFIRGFSETKASWPVILISCLTCCVISLIWIFLLRWILAPIIYLCIILIFVILVLMGYFAFKMANDLENVQLPGESGTGDQVKLWRAIQYICWIGAAVYFVAMIWMLKRIRIAIAIMKEGSKAFLDNPGLVIIPPVVLVLLFGFVLFFIIITLYIQTIGTLDNTSFTNAATSAFGSAAVNLTINAVNSSLSAYNNATNSTSNSSSAWNISNWNQDNVIRGLHAYNFFGFLWVANLAIMTGFFIMALTTCTWYFSATTVELDQYDQDVEGGRQKTTEWGTAIKCFCIALRYHFGTILWGSLLIAIIQFIRVVFLYLQEEILDQYKDTATVKIVIYCINCCLAYIERVIKIISKNAFIITCIKNVSFCSAAGEAMEILVSNCVRVAALSIMSTIAHFILKLFIVCTNCLIAYGLLTVESLTNDEKIESGLFPMVGIFILSFIIASLFINVYESCTDTVMMCFLIDERDLDGEFMPISLCHLLDNFGHVEEARRQYEKMMREATDPSMPQPTTAVAQPKQSKKPSGDNNPAPILEMENNDGEK